MEQKKSNHATREIASLPKTPGLLGTVHDIARYMGLTPRRVQQLAREGIIERAGRGGYDIIRCLSMYVSYLSEWRSSAEIPCSMADLSNYFGLTEGQIIHLVRKGVIPAPISHGHYDLAAAVRGFVAFVHRRGFVNFYGQGRLDFAEHGSNGPAERQA